MHIDRTKDLASRRIEAVRLALLPGAVVTARDLARLVGVSERTVFRYILELRQSGETIIGEAGVGFQMVRREKTGVKMAGPGRPPLTQLEIYETLAASYEASARMLSQRAGGAVNAGLQDSLHAASFTMASMADGAKAVVDKLKGQS